MWRSDDVTGAHLAEFGYQREAYKLASIENATSDWIDGAPGARNSAFRGKTEIDALFAQDKWRFAPGWKTLLGARYAHWHAHDGAMSNATTTVQQGERSENHILPKAALDVSKALRGFRSRPSWRVQRWPPGATLLR